MKLHEVCKLFADGDWIESKDQAPEGIRLVQTGNIGEGKYLEKEGREKYISEKTFCDLKCTEVFPGDVLISRLPDPVGRGCIVPQTREKMITAVDCTICRTDESLINNEYLCYFLQSRNYYLQLDQNVTGTTRKRISRKNLGNVEVKVLPLESQRDIVFKLNKLTSVIRNRQKQIELLDELIKARFVEMFGDPETNPKDWEKRPLADVITAANNGMARRGNDEDGNIVMRLVELQDGYIDYSKPNRIILTEAEKKRYLLKDKDFLFARVNGNPENVGRCAVFYDIGEPVFHNDHIIRVHFDDEDLDGPFASALLNSEYGKRQLRNQIKTSAGQYTVSQDGIGAIVAILPPIEIQRQFAAFVGQVDKSKVAVQKALDEAQLLFDSLMQEYFG